MESCSAPKRSRAGFARELRRCSALARGRQVAGILQMLLAEPMGVGEQRLAIDFAIGVAQADGAVIDVPAGVRRATEAMRHARRLGPGRLSVDADLTGLLVGATLATKPEEVYRALIEATAYGTRVIVETFEEHGVPIHELVACGGLADKNPLLMQIYADVTGRPFKLSASDQTPALGSAMFAAVAAGAGAGGYATIADASRAMARLKDRVFEPIPANQAVYDILYREYVRLHDYFGRGENDVMKVLKGLRTRVRAGGLAPAGA